MMNVLGLLLAGYSALLLLAFFGQRRLIYPLRGSGAQPRLDGAKVLRIPGAAGRMVHALYAEPPASMPTVVHFHGNGEELADEVPFFEALRGRGLGVYAIEYPGYGLSRDWDPSEAAIYADAERALEHLLAVHGVARDRLVMSGRSLGTGVAIEMLRRGYGTRAVLLSPFTSVLQVASLTLPFLPNRWLLKDHFDNLAKASGISVPVLVIHGTRDEVIPFAMGQRLSSQLPHAVFLPAEGANHNDLLARGGSELLDTIAGFLKKRGSP